MQLLVDIWRIVCSLGNALLYNPPSLPGWATWVTLMIRIVVSFVIFRRNIAPFLLAKISRRIRARSISLRSIKGLYFRSSRRTWKVERIGWSFHPWAESRMSVKIEGLRVEIGMGTTSAPDPPGSAHQSQSVTRGLRTRLVNRCGHIASDTVEWFSNWTLISLLLEWLRTLAFSFLIVTAQVFIQGLSILAQNVDIELDSVAVSFKELSGARIKFQGISLGTKINFSQISKEDPTPISRSKKTNTIDNKTTPKQWNAVLRGGADRFWERMWGQMEGSASFEMSICEIIGHTCTGSAACLFCQDSPSGGKQSFGSSKSSRGINPTLPSDVFLRVSRTMQVLVSLKFSPRHQTIKQHSLDCSLDIPAVELSADRILSIIKIMPPNETPKKLKRLTFKQMFNNRSYSSLISSSPPPVVSPASPTSPTSPLMSAFSQMARKRGSMSFMVPVIQRLREPKTQSVVVPLNSLEIRLSSITVAHCWSTKSNDLDKEGYVLGVDDFTVRLALSDAKTNPLHRKWLGSRSDPASDDSTYRLTGKIGLLTASRIPRILLEPSLQLIALRHLAVDLLIHQWPPKWMTKPQFLAGDPNESLVACELSVVGFYVTDRLDDLRTTIDMIALSKDKSVLKPMASSSLLFKVPRIEFRTICDDIQFFLMTDNTEATHSVPLLVLNTSGFNGGLSTYFRYSAMKPERVTSLQFDQSEIVLDSSCYFSLQPTFIRLRLPSQVSSDASHSVPELEPLFSMDTVDILAAGTTLGIVGSNGTVEVDLYTHMADVRCIMDGINIELWKPECVSALRGVVDIFRAPGSVSSPNSQSTPLAALRAGLTVHVAIGNVTGVITAPDLNPDCDLELSRGLELTTGISLQYCCLKTTRHALRVKTRFSHAKAREQLGLPEDLIMQALAISSAETDPNDITALVQVSAWQTACRVATATRFEYGADEGTAGEGDLIFVPQTIAKALLCRRNQDSSIIDRPCEATCDVSINIPHLRSHLDLLNAYSALLALHTFKRLLPPNPAKAETLPRGPTVRSKFRLRMGSTHVFVVFPLQERLFIQILSTTVEHNPAMLLKAESKSVAGWGQSVQVHGKYEELLRGRDICITTDSNKSEVSVAAEGLRVSIPHRYVLSDLILDINVTLKAFRHIHRLTELEHYQPLPTPFAEEPKRLPVFHVHIRTVTLEAADSPFEAKLGLIWKVGFQAQRVRIERERAFDAKLGAIMASGDSQPGLDSGPQSDLRYHFTSKRTTSIADARHRLNMVHSNSWISSISHHTADICRKEDTILRQLRHASDPVGLHVPIPISIYTPEKAPPLFRAVFIGLSVFLSPPNFPDGYQGFLADLGEMPRSTLYSLLLPMHLRITLDAAVINIRNYPLPMLNIPLDSNGPSLDFVTDLVFAEEMGPMESVEWLSCTVVPPNSGITGASTFSIQVPKTIMPVKSYASPEIKFRTTKFTEFTWGVSYNPAVQEVMRVIETLSHPPHDPSPAIGFWDKLRLVFHWRIHATFKGGAQLHFKGSRDPYHIVGVGAGFDFRWEGNVLLKSGYENPENELAQLSSDSMIITIPDHSRYQGNFIGELFNPNSEHKNSPSAPEIPDQRKICAKFCDGIRWGIGIGFERTCGSECKTCQGDSFSRTCRFFNFIPHYDVILRTVINSDEKVHDSYNGFRSDFIHFSTSLTSPLKQHGGSKRNSFHLTPMTFAHFWSWWHLFDGALSLPIRQGILFPESRPPSKKFGRHLATIKYRIDFSTLYIAHVYKVDSGEAWEAGESQCVGVKAYIDHFQADMHQREEETTITKRETYEPTVIRHKPFSAVDVVMTGLDLRALFAVFAEPQKKTIPLKHSAPDSTRFWETLNPIPLSSSWMDGDDFLELDWVPIDKKPDLYLHEAAQCPRFVYFKRSPRIGLSGGDGVERSKTKFGDEDTHICLMGKEPSAQEVQLEFVSQRLSELRRQAQTLNKGSGPSMNDRYSERRSSPVHSGHETRATTVTQMITLLERYTERLTHLRASSTTFLRDGSHNAYDDVYDIPAGIELPQELGDFSNVYQVHCPKIHLNNATRDILQKYYLASRARRGFEYHMSARAVKFIRDQALSIRSEPQETDPMKRQPRAGSAHAAAQAVRRILTGDERHKEAPANGQPLNNIADTNPLYGWDQGVSERKAHLCLLLKPQIVLRSGHSTASSLVLAADHVILRNYGILDTLNADDPVSGYVMQRNYASINSLQVFRPVDGTSTDHLPLEVFLDIRCESRDFDRVVPQTNATLRYDKFNRLRLRNDITTVAVSTNVNNLDMTDHLLHETDLIVIQVPRFSISANASAFASMSDVVTDLLLFSDPAHKARMSRLETMLFSYDFTDLASASKVVADLQSRIRQLIRLEGAYLRRATDLNDSGQQDLLASKAHILTLSQELNLIFDAIRLAQDKADERNQEKKSALRLRVSSSDISWQMLDENRELLAKLAVRGIDFSWLSRQDGSTASLLSVVDLQAFDGSPNALWPEILAKYDDPPNHHMIRRGLFVEVQWSVLAPVGGISIYDHFKVQLHPIRLALETQLGNKLVDYLIPGRRTRREAFESESNITEVLPHRRSHSDDFSDARLEDEQGPSPPQVIIRPPSDPNPSTTSQLTVLKTRPAASRSFSNLRSAASETRNQGYYAPGLPKSSSSTALVERRHSGDSDLVGVTRRKSGSANNAGSKPDGDASEMRQRSTQKTFVHVEIPSVHVLLSVMKGRGFLVRDARLRTHDLEWRNRTLSFEELFSHFIPSDPSLRGWVKVAWQQPIFSVGGVVKELITKTQWGRLGKAPEVDHPIQVRRKSSQPSQASESGAGQQQAVVPLSSSSASRETLPFPSSQPEPTPSRSQTGETSHRGEQPRPRSLSRSRVSSLFGRRSGSNKPSIDSIDVPPLPKGPK